MALTQLGPGAFPSGSVLQTVTAIDSEAALFTSTDSSGPETIVSAAITPSSTSSKVLITGFLSIGVLYSTFSGTLHWIGIRLFRGSTEIGMPSATDLDTMTTVHGATGDSARATHSCIAGNGMMASKTTAVPFHFVDSPSTTSATTYNIKGLIEHQGNQYTMIQNGAGYNYNNEEAQLATSNLTLMEIKG